jgi:polyisoprenoid-binding protein YceI
MRKMFLFNTVMISAAILFASCNRSVQQQSSKDEPTSSEEVTLHEDFRVDLTQSKVLWMGEALGVYQHEGTVNFNVVSLTVSDGVITGGNFVVDLQSIISTDENFNPEEGYSKEKLKGHLMSPDFFDVENHPNASFAIENVENDSATGILSIRGYEHPEKVENITITQEGERIEISGDLVFNRKKYDVSWDYPMKDRILSEDITLKIILVGS